MNIDKYNNLTLYCKISGNSTFFPVSKPIKMMAYADDLLVLLSSSREWSTLLSIMQTYHSASNAKINMQNTVLFPLNGYPHQE
ncbi:hypothetical protein K450DRAFT_241263 [Umbelopsis ramanniana AG]|uniref:Reverse transcriptase domain-containing protein n=1 Tax=Umbelopsis ramanniana AG TaxID=1314678 RepID=A0AAD5HCY6_UMBRA|nr:uncharacterized protein K450DRAFT_241263 [Umbelopsis ramanniana AG]KAI8579735.1 hypothetical protein K450DRAFT_241263 [Umbelopsis ramanniana AG]